MNTFSKLQSRHEDLIKTQASNDVLEQVRDYIEEVKSSSSNVSSTQERDQLRANMRYWANYVYERTGTYPNIELAPSTSSPDRRNILGISFIILILVALAVLGFPIIQEMIGDSTLTQIPAATHTKTITPLISSPTMELIETSIPTEILPNKETHLPPKVTLTSIQNGQTVPCYNDLSGTYVEGLEEYIWPVVISGDGFYPQDVGAGKAASKISGEWFGVARFGNCDILEPDKGKRFELLIVTANESANAEFEAYFENAIQTGDWGSMPALPSSGVEVQVHISVIRE